MMKEIKDKQMERYTVFFQIINSIFQRIRTKSFTIFVEAHKVPNTLNKLEKEKWR